jgi:hypothetical protein
MTNAVIELMKAKNGLTTARARGSNGASFMLHSAYDPVAEAQRLVQGSPSLKKAGGIVCLGLGLGYHVQEILHLVPTETEVLVIESNGQLKEWYHNAENTPRERVTIADGEDAVKAFIYRICEKLRDGLVLFEHPASLRLDPEFYDNMRSRVRDYVSLLLVDMETAKNLSYIVQQNNLDNLPVVISDPGINVLENAFKDKPAVIVSAGPSLNKNIDLLAEAKNKSVIICVGTALKAMLAQGLHPDIVVTLDATELNYRLFTGLAPTEEFLCYEPQTHDKIPPLFAGRRFVFNSFSSPFTTWLRELYGNKGYVDPGGSVAIAAFGIACLIGANPIVLIGQDLAYTGGYTHAKGTVYDGRKADLTTLNLHLLEVPAVGGGKVFTPRNMHTFLVRFEELFAQHNDRLVIDATEGGALKRGTKVMTFREAIDRYFTKEFPVLTIFKDLHRKHLPDPAVRKRVRKEFKKTALEYERFIRKLDKTLSIATKVYKLNELAEKMNRNELQYGGTFVANGILETLKKKGEELNRKLKEVNAQAKLIDLLGLLAVDVELAPLLPESATFKEQVERIKLVYGLYLEAAKIMREQLVDIADNLVSNDNIQVERECIVKG